MSCSLGCESKVEHGAGELHTLRGDIGARQVLGLWQDVPQDLGFLNGRVVITIQSRYQSDRAYAGLFCHPVSQNISWAPFVTT